mmetsp:Transcript_3199/g.4746  ORF Transcript_3199/g.4746 Transcript_3199/m.4746 type:complete len:115 (+) Transcript_3199:106-450(+)|eukprot:CAMPEP_0194205344 /NCGR_PEP_ID=MMETSP0156-20130528/4645_1 /TAXON_ID=33649 /ORGANISM="Thalassionema nitzschioides, Strain L26-B" /LENGTH=114 /DNA_ID=CAMNT_0038931595 /DNA_START=92 /DNA_END=436 /DNA_ORIENTATION=+
MAEEKTGKEEVAKPVRPKSSQTRAGTIKKLLTHLHFLTFAGFMIALAMQFEHVRYVFAGYLVTAAIAYVYPPVGLAPETLGAIPVYQEDLDAEIKQGLEESKARVKAKQEKKKD